MIDLRPVGYVIGLMILGLGAFMIAPAIVDATALNPDWRGFVVSSILTLLVGGALTLGCSTGRRGGLTIEQAFLLTVLSWVALPLFGALPFVLGDYGASGVDALFESVSGITTTGATIIVDLNEIPPGILLWRALLQWMGGVGIVIFAMIFLPTLQVGGMQLFRSEAFDTAGKILPRATEISISIFTIYLGLTLACALVYGLCGQNAFDALCHAMTTLATGGLANYNGSFGELSPASQYAAVVFMILAGLPFVRYVQLVRGDAEPLWRDSQIRTFFAVIAAVVVILSLVRFQAAETTSEESFRQSLFNTVSLITGTGYTNASYDAWGPFAVSILFLIGLIGGCAGSTCCSVKIFRYQVLAAIVVTEMRRVRRPNAIFTARYEGRPLKPDVVTSVLTFFFMFIASLAVLTLVLTYVGLDAQTALSAAASALANIGPGFGPIVGPDGNYASLPDSAKFALIVGMLLGRLELLSVLILFTPNFWLR
ncbi:MAG: TrkH family potassium uptake protein [Pseudomonadota bacterium]